MESGDRDVGKKLGPVFAKATVFDLEPALPFRLCKLFAGFSALYCVGRIEYRGIAPDDLGFGPVEQPQRAVVPYRHLAFGIQQVDGVAMGAVAQQIELSRQHPAFGGAATSDERLVGEEGFRRRRSRWWA